MGGTVDNLLIFGLGVACAFMTSWLIKIWHRGAKRNYAKIELMNEEVHRGFTTSDGATVARLQVALQVFFDGAEAERLSGKL